MMTHAEAIATRAAGGFLLDMLPADEREAFAEHFFVCPECAEAVRLGTLFIVDLRAALCEAWGEGGGTE